MKAKPVLLLLFSPVVCLYCHAQQKMNMMETIPLDTAVIEKIMGVKGKASNGEYKVTVPQNDLSVEVDGFKIIPAMGLGTWIDFAPSSDGAMIMGDLILTETD